MSKAIEEKLDRVISLLERLVGEEALPLSVSSKIIAEALPSSKKGQSEPPPKEERPRHEMSDAHFADYASEIVHFLLDTREVPNFVLTPDVLADELNKNPTTTARVLRRLAEEHILSVGKDGLISIPDIELAEMWAKEHPIPDVEVKPLDAYNTLQAAKLVRILLQPNVLLKGKVINSLFEEMGVQRNGVERLVRKLSVEVPFVTKEPGVGSAVRIDHRYINQARRWLAEAEKMPEEGEPESRGVSEEMFKSKAPTMVSVLLKGPSNTAELMHATGTKYHSCRSVLKRLHDEGVPIVIGVHARGQAAPVRLGDTDAASRWLNKRMLMDQVRA